VPEGPSGPAPDRHRRCSLSSALFFSTPYEGDHFRKVVQPATSSALRGSDAISIKTGKVSAEAPPFFRDTCRTKTHRADGVMTKLRSFADARYLTILNLSDRFNATSNEAPMHFAFCGSLPPVCVGMSIVEPFRIVP